MTCIFQAEIAKGCSAKLMCQLFHVLELVIVLAPPMLHVGMLNMAGCYDARYDAGYDCHNIAICYWK